MSDSPSPTSADLPATLRADFRGPVAVLTLNRPEKRNALNHEIILGLGRFFRCLPAEVAVVVVAAAGDHFSAGLDLAEMGERETIAGIVHSRMWHRAFELVESGPVPVVAALKGGGGRWPGVGRRRAYPG